MNTSFRKAISKLYELVSALHQYITLQMCEEVVEFVPDQFKTQEMCEKAVAVRTICTRLYVKKQSVQICDQFKTQEMCEKAIAC